jgi:hypothetical protein
MSEQLGLPRVTRESLARLEEHVRSRLGGRVQELKVVFMEDGLVLRGYARAYYAKQLAQHALMETTGLPIRANEIEVS